MAPNEWLNLMTQHQFPHAMSDGKLGNNEYSVRHTIILSRMQLYGSWNQGEDLFISLNRSAHQNNRPGLQRKRK